MISEQLACRIRDLRSQGYTQMAIAKHLGVSRHTIVRVIQGTWRPRQFRRRQLLRLLELWQGVMALTPGTLVGQCRACGEPVYLPCVSCLAGILDLIGVRVPIELPRGLCDCGGNFQRLRRAPAKELPAAAEGEDA